MFGRLILKEKQARLILFMRSSQQPCTTTKLSKECNITYVHATNFINECTKLGLVSIEKHGKLKMLKLTDKGAQLADLVMKIDGLIYNPIKQDEAPK